MVSSSARAASERERRLTLSTSRSSEEQLATTARLRQWQGPRAPARQAPAGEAGAHARDQGRGGEQVVTV
eukprot:6186966-Pleurochrysis_carterae.AAC.2